ncbi:MAG: Gfo/Idh/MocA family oxidoreductase [Lentisphaeria bacterium]|nr:Gfo/Idh/MocA family oxidoreductase [Lentisphaeria bacterium]NQZ67302.1 Gfo/Idh/MocA family oxidoreductase [Lentisphaeria bacterium]
MAKQIIGIIGAENSHTAAIAKTINIDKKVRGFSVDYVWGETSKFAKAAAEGGTIPNIVKNTDDMLGKVDAILVDHRHAKFHLDAIRPYVEAGVPTFVDKPFCFRSRRGAALLELAKKKKTPITSFSVIPHQQSFADFKKSLRTNGKWITGATYGPGDIKSKHGGVFFYGIHQVESILMSFGYDMTHVHAVVNKPNTVIQCLYSEGRTVSMHLSTSSPGGFSASALCEKGMVHQPFVFDDNMYLSGIKEFCKMFRTGKEPLTHEQILKPVKVLEAMEKSIASGKRVKV